MSCTVERFSEVDHAAACARTQRPSIPLCRDSDQLHDVLRNALGLNVPRQAVCAGHSAPFEYMKNAYFEPAADQIVWAPRGGGKTRLAAAATLLDLLHKPGIQVRLLGGSLEQSLRVWEHLLPDLEKHAFEIDDHPLRGRSVILPNGSKTAVLPQSQRAVRGLRVQKLRCDEVELFDPRIWEAAQLIVRSATLTRDDRAIAGQIDVRGSIEALSTFHNPWGMMSRLIERGIERGTRIIKWCILDVLEHCPPERVCDACLLWDECQGVAKKTCNGFFRIDDAIAHKQRVSSNTWQAEMLCRRPSTRDAVFDTFDPSVHVRDDVPTGPVKERSLAMDFGFRNPFVCLWIVSFADGTTHVIDEYVQEQRMLEEHLQHIEQRPWGKLRHVACDPAGAGRNAQTGQSDLAVLRSRGYVPRARASRILDGIEQIRFALKSASGEVRFFVAPRCVRLIKALQCYHYSKDGSELPCKDGEHDHLIDALRYHFINRDRGEVRGGRVY